MILNKKGSLDLSTNAIVILILAIVFLGLGLAFVNNIFETMETEFEGAFDPLTQQRVERLKTSDKVFDLESYTVDLRSEGRKIVFMLIDNAEVNNVDWTITKKKSLVGAGLTANCPELSLSTVTATTTVLAKSDLVLPVLLKASKTDSKGTCVFLLKATPAAGDAQTAELTVNLI
jgi:hypothetical protein